jgi:hypothetical protein
MREEHHADGYSYCLHHPGDHAMGAAAMPSNA